MLNNYLIFRKRFGNLSQFLPAFNHINFANTNTNKNKTMKSFILLVIFYLGLIVASFAGTIKGTVIDAKDASNLAGVIVILEKQNKTTVTDGNGVFEFNDIPNGSYKLTIRYVSYKAQTINVNVSDNTPSVLVKLVGEGNQLKGVTLKSSKITHTEMAVISEVKKNNVTVSAVGAAQISKSMDRNAADVVKRIPGVTVQDDKFIMVRGLMDRYNTTWLNDAAAPSSEIDKKAFSFDVIPSGAIDRLLVFKTPSADLPGDFAGGMVKVYTSSIPEKNGMTFGMQTSYRQNSTGTTINYNERSSTDFLGYDTQTSEGQILALLQDGNIVNKVSEGDDVMVVLNQTPFYAESGGQIADNGSINVEKNEIIITDVKKKAGVFIHIGRVVFGEISNGSSAELSVNTEMRSGICNSHTATHLLNEALRSKLGQHIAQRGSLNAENRLRFDFSHSKSMTQSELRNVELEVNNLIRQNSSVETRIMTPEDARELGAQALFGEKYGDEVRVVSMGNKKGSGKGLAGNTYSLELCGGTHVQRTGQIGAFALIAESASAGGVRRIEAFTGKTAELHHAEQSKIMNELASIFKTKTENVIDRVKSLIDERKVLQNEIINLRKAVAMGSNDDSQNIVKINNLNFYVQTFDDVPSKDLRSLVDEHKNRLGSGIILLISGAGGKAAISAGVTSDLTDQINAVDLVKIVAVELGGKGGGGRPDMAQAGGNDMANVKKAISLVENFLKEL